MNQDEPTQSPKVGPHEAFWRGAFGNQYTERNSATEQNMHARRLMWQTIMGSVHDKPASILEVGANLGVNMSVLAELCDADLHALEPNETAREQLASSGCVSPANIYDAIGSNIPLGDGAVDMVFTSGVLIHVPPSDLEDTVREMLRVSSKYVLCIEYFSPKPETISYRGHSERLYKRDFGSLFLECDERLKTVDYGFFWKPATGLDDLTWWLFERQ